MHGTLDKGMEVDSEALFFADLPDSPDPSLILPPVERSAYGAGRRPNWALILTIAALHLITFYALVKFDVIHIAEKKRPMVVVDLIDPPAPPAEKPAPEPVEVQKAVPEVIVPPPVVSASTPPPPPIAVTSTPPTPKPVEAAAPPPSGPVTVGNLDERMIESRAPRYPRGSIIKREQGTVVLRVLIGTDGRIQQVSVAQSSGFERLDQAALDAVRYWRWQPMVRNGQPVEVRGTLEFPFTLKA